MPWVSPVFFAFDSEINLFWLSEEAAQHSIFLAANPTMSCVVFDSSAPAGTGNAVYFSGSANLSVDGDLKKPLQLLAARGPKTGSFSRYALSDISGDSPWRLYQFAPDRAWTLGPSEDVNGWTVNRRKELDLKTLGQAV